MDDTRPFDVDTCSLGIELGSTRIKAVLIDAGHRVVASASHRWENQFENGYWTYSDEAIWHGVQESYTSLANNIRTAHGFELASLGSIGISGMMHGYVVLGRDGEPLVPFRTWRNTTTGRAAAELTDLLQFKIPQRWSIAHLYQAILDAEEHIDDIAHLTTLSGYVHLRLTGEHVLGVGEAAGVFPIDSNGVGYDREMMQRFNQRIDSVVDRWRLEDILPSVLPAGEPAGRLTEAGSRTLDRTARLRPGIPLCPPEGDAGTGMVATNSVAGRTANVSAGTSAFAMVVLDRPLSAVHDEIDLVTTPTGRPVAMVHSNNCTSDLNAWVRLFGELCSLAGNDIGEDQLFDLLHRQALHADADGGGLLAYNFVSGEHLVGIDSGRPLFVRTSTSELNLANFVRTQLFSAIAALRIGLDVLIDVEGVEIDRLLGHGGYFKTSDVGQRMMAAALNMPVAVMETADEGGAWGIAVLASYLRRADRTESLEAYLDTQVFARESHTVVGPDRADVSGFETFIGRYRDGLAIERTAVETLP